MLLFFSFYCILFIQILVVYQFRFFFYTKSYLFLPPPPLLHCTTFCLNTIVVSCASALVLIVCSFLLKSGIRRTLTKHRSNHITLRLKILTGPSNTLQRVALTLPPIALFLGHYTAAHPAPGSSQSTPGPLHLRGFVSLSPSHQYAQLRLLP